MASAFAAKRRRSKAVKEQLFPISKFGRCVIALAPIKPALWLSERVQCSERHANFLINGKRKPSARAVAAIVVEIVA